MFKMKIVKVAHDHATSVKNYITEDLHLKLFMTHGVMRYLLNSYDT